MLKKINWNLLFKIWVLIGIAAGVLLACEILQISNDGMYALFNAPVASAINNFVDLIATGFVLAGVYFTIDYLVKKEVL